MGPIFAAVVFAARAALGDGAASRPARAVDVTRDFLAAIVEGRPDDISGSCQAADADSQAVLKDLKALAAAMGDIRQAAADKYGAGTEDIVRPVLTAPDAEMNETITGDRAVVETEDLSMRAELVKVNGLWKLDVAQLIKSGEIGDDAHHYLLGLTAAVQRTTKDIKAGKFDDAASARDALQARQGGIEATTRP